MENHQFTKQGSKRGTKEQRNYKIERKQGGIRNLYLSIIKRKWIEFSKDI